MYFNPLLLCCHRGSCPTIRYFPTSCRNAFFIFPGSFCSFWYATAAVRLAREQKLGIASLFKEEKDVSFSPIPKSGPDYTKPAGS